MQVGHVLADDGVTGGVRAVVDALCALRPDENRVVFAVRPGQPWSLARRCWPWPVPGWDDHALRELAGLDVVVAHGVFNPSTTRLVQSLRRRRPRPVLLAFPHDAYDDGLFSSRRRTKQTYFRAVERPWLSASDGVLVTAPSHVAWLARHGVQNEVVVRGLGLTPGEHASAVRVREARTSRPTREGVRLLFVGRWDVHEKGLDLLLPAVAEVARRVPGLRLRLVGPTVGARAEVARLAAATGAPVDLVGFVDDVWEEIADADLMVQPSRKEGFGLAALQALSAGVPVVLSSVSGLAEQVDERDGAALVPPRHDGVLGGLSRAVDARVGLERAARAFSCDRAPGLGYEPVLDGLLSLAARRRGS